MTGPAPPPSPVVEQVYRHRLSAHRSWLALRWFLINLSIAALLLLELVYNLLLDLLGLSHSLLNYVTLALFIIFLLNAVLDLIRYLHLTFNTIQPGQLTDRQRQLLGVRENEFSRTPPSGGRVTSNWTGPVGRSASVVGYTPPPTMSRSFGSSPVQSFGSAGVSPYGVGCSSPYSQHTSLNNSYSPSTSPRHLTQPNPSPFTTPQDSFGLETLTLRDVTNSTRDVTTSPRQRLTRRNDVMDMKALDEILRDEERRQHQRTIQEQSLSSTNGGLFSNVIQRYGADVTSQFPYQMACRSPQSVSALTDDDSSTDTAYRADEVWPRLGISQTALEIWVERLRRFLSQTIMSRVSKEIRKLNKQLRRLGLDEMEIGEVSIPTLKQIAVTKGHQLQSLNSVIQFLDISANQQYVVSRIHELGKGGCMSDFNWNGGMDYKSKPWAEHLPTDCAIVMHCLCTYLDARLPPHPKFPDGRTFTSQHFLKVPDKPKRQDGRQGLVIYQTRINPPHFKVLVSGQDQAWDLAKGRNNMFHAILLFLYFIKTQEAGMLDRVSLGMSGINILWVLDEG